MKRNIPQLLIFARLLMAPVMWGTAWYFGNGATWLVITLIILGFASDVLDGIVARHQGQSSARLRRMDSQVDMLFWLSAGFALWHIHPELVRQNKVGILFLFLMEASCYGVSLLKFGKETCTHAWLSKFWGITLLMAFIAMLGSGSDYFFFNLCLWAGLISHLDRIAITLLLPEWNHDIPSAYHAWLIRKGKSFKKFKLLNG